MQNHKNHAGLALAFAAVAFALSACNLDHPMFGFGGKDTPIGTIDTQPFALKVLSNRPDLISGGDALLEVTLPTGADASKVKVMLGGKDVTSQFTTREDGRFVGLVTDLAGGTNQLTASMPGQSDSSVTLIDHPNGGPVFSGPQIQPWHCPDSAIDAQCNQPAVFNWYYISSNPLKAGLQPYDPANPASDVATTTTQSGDTLPFILREEIGYQDRDQYRIVVLYQPDKDWTALAPQPQWNHKMLVLHGSSCGVSYGAGGAPTEEYNGAIAVGIPLVDEIEGESPTVALGLGFAVMSTALDHNGHNCNIAVQAESLIMAKEHLIEHYGELRYTIGTGCSGGSLAQQQLANAYPGIYQGILPQCSFPDTWSSATQVMDYHLLRSYFEHPGTWGTGVVWNPEQWAAVEGNLLPVDAIISDIGFFEAVVPTADCGGTDDTTRYNAATNPGGVRCGLPDYMINVLGPRPESVWSSNEKLLGRGFGGIAVDNVGVQYGLATLQQGLITPAMFLDLNQKIGGLDVDIAPSASRLAGDPLALTNVYKSGALNVGNNLGDVAIIDLRGPDPGIAHDSYRSWAVRARLDKENGGHANHVIWFGAFPVLGDLNYATNALLAMDRWLTAVEADPRALPLSQKIASDKPEDIHDRCTQIQGLAGADGLFIPLAGVLLDPILGPILNPTLAQALDSAYGLIIDPASDMVCGIGLVQTLVQMRFQTPRMVAGDAITTEVNKCQLKPLNRDDNYGPLPLSDDQWTALQALYPDGVCDYALPGVGYGKTVPWQTYQDGSGNVIYGGQAMPAAPLAAGWTSASFGHTQ